MAVDPQDITAAKFPQVRFRPGYDVELVDDFLDKVELAWRRDRERIAELERRIAELRQR